MDIALAITHAYPERTITLHPFLCRASSGDAQPLGNKQIAWVAPHELDRYPFPAANAAIIAKIGET